MKILINYSYGQTQPRGSGRGLILYFQGSLKFLRKSFRSLENFSRKVSQLLWYVRKLKKFQGKNNLLPLGLSLSMTLYIKIYPCQIHHFSFCRNGSNLSCSLNKPLIIKLPKILKIILWKRLKFSPLKLKLQTPGID